MLAFAKAGPGARIPVQYDANGMNVTAYAVRDSAGRVFVTTINKEAQADAVIALALPPRVARASVLRLEGPSLDSKTGVTLGSAEANAEGKWSAAKEEPVGIHNGGCNIHLPAASAAILTTEID